MKFPLARAYVFEFLGVFALVYFGAGVVCVNQLTMPPEQQEGTTALLGRHPGLVGIALAQGFILAAALAATMHVSGGYLNPAITIMLWVFNRIESQRASWLLGAQFLAALTAGLCLRFTFADGVLKDARLGTPHLVAHAYPDLNWGSLLGGGAVELVLTFFLVFAIFGSIRTKSAWRNSTGGAAKTEEQATRSVDARLAAIMAGFTLSAGVLFAWPLTGAALNPARWFGTAIWEAVFALSPQDRGPFADTLVYIAGPTVGALLAGLVFFSLLKTEEKKESGKSKKAK